MQSRGSDIDDVPSGQDQLKNGVDTLTTFGSFTNDFFTPGAGGNVIDFANFGGGWANEWVDLPDNRSGAGISDLLITPLGNFELFGDFQF